MFELLPESLPHGPQPALLALPGASSSLRGLIPADVLERYRCLPLKVIDNLLVLALPEPHDRIAIDDVGLITGLDVEPVPLRGFEPVSCEVQATVTGCVALVEVAQTFANPFTEEVEAVYSFPLPAGAVLHTFAVGAREAGHRAAGEGTGGPTLTVQGPLRAELGALPPGETVEVRFRYLQRLESSLSETVLRLPPGPRMRVRVELETGGRPLRRLAASEPVESVTHEAVVQLEAHSEKGLEVRFGFQSSELGAVLFTHGEHFLLHLTPPLELARAPQPRDVVLVMDFSERMAGERWTRALSAVGQLLDLLEPGDRLRVLVYHDKLLEHGEGLRAEDAGGVETFLRGLRPNGPDSALPRAARVAWETPCEPGREPFLIFIGSPDERSLIWQRPPRRFFGIGHSEADQAFLAPFGPFAHLDDPAGVSRLLRQLGRPVLSDLCLVDEGLNYMTEGLSRLGDLHASRTVSVSGWKLGDGPVEVRGTLASGAAWSQRVLPIPSRNPALGLAWALNRIEEFERRGRDAEVLALSQRYGLPCRQTRFLLSGGGAPALEAELTGADPRIVRVVNLILTTALSDRATHIHYEEMVRYRVDGVLHEVMEPPPWVRAEIFARFRTLCGLEPGVTPAQGTFSVEHQSRPYDVAVTFVPTATGEKLTVFLRPGKRQPAPLPDPLQQLLGVEGLVFLSHDLLPAAVAHHTTVERHVVVYGKSLRMGEGPTYLDGRTRLPLDTDVLVGDAYCDEMLDVPRAVAGAPGSDVMLTLMRLQGHREMCARVRGIAAERRLRRSCGCAKGCDRCKETGFFGELRLHEVLWVTDEVRAALDGPSAHLRAVARKARGATFVEQARAAADRGETTFAEVVRVFGADAHG